MQAAVVISNVFTGIFLCIILSYYVLLLVPKAKGTPIRFRSITVVIPAHNEEKYIADAINSVLRARFDGRKEIIVVDDGSTDRTSEIVKELKKNYEINAKASLAADKKAMELDKELKNKINWPKIASITLLRTNHEGKSNAINRATKISRGELIAIVDGDSAIHEDALEEAVRLFNSEKVAGVCAVIKVKNRSSLLGVWLHLEQLYASLTRALVAKVNANIVAAGPLSIFRKDVLEELGGFGTKGFAEDADIAIRMIKAGYRIEYAEKAVTETNMPVSWKGFYRQRSRFARGTVNIIRRHVRLDRSAIRIYTLPLIVFGYLQAVVMAVITLYNIGAGYWQYFASQGVYFNTWVVKFVIGWLSIYGIINWAVNVFTGVVPLTAMTAIGLTASLLTYPLYLLAVIKYDKGISLWEILAIAFFAPFWMIVMAVYFLNLPEWGRKHQRNIWEK